MRLGTALVGITFFFINRINVEAGIVAWQWPQDKTCNHINGIHYQVMEECLKSGLVTDKVLDTCYKLNSQGPCNFSEILVFTKGPCLQTECVVNRDSEGLACEEGWYNHNGICTEAGQPNRAELGRRARPDLYGDVHCVCDQELGFLEMAGKCYFEFSQGPCQPGEHLIMNISRTLEPMCVKNTCDSSEGYVLSWTNNGTENLCYSMEFLYRKYNSPLLTSNEQVMLDNALVSIVPFSTFNNCHARAQETNECLETIPEPGLGPKERLLLNMRKAFNLTGSLVDGELENGVKNRTLVQLELDINTENSTNK